MVVICGDTYRTRRVVSILEFFTQYFKTSWGLFCSQEHGASYEKFENRV